MFERFGVEGHDRRNLVVVVVIMTLVLMVLAEGPILARFVVGVIGGVVSGIVFIVATAVLKAIAYG